MSHRRAPDGDQPPWAGQDHDEPPRVVSVVNIGDASVSIDVNRVLSETELTIVGERSSRDVERCKSANLANETCAIAILEDVAAVVKSFDDVDIGEITVRVSDTTISKNLFA